MEELIETLQVLAIRANIMNPCVVWIDDRGKHTRSLEEFTAMMRRGQLGISDWCPAIIMNCNKLE